MTREEALRAIAAPDLDRRLEAARALALYAQPADAEVLQRVLSTERVVWVRTALRHAIQRATRHVPSPPEAEVDIGDVVSPEAFDQIRTIAVHAVTTQVVHEIAPVVGFLQLCARQEVPRFEESKTKEQIDRLRAWLDALNRLSRAAVPPALQEFELSAMVRRVVDTEITGRSVKVELAGAAPLLVIGDPILVEMALANGVRNAIEAVEQLHGKSDELPPVVVNWGDTDRDIWVAILDKGAGPPAAIERAFEMGSTTKEGHLGMGLATARQAIESLSGTVGLTLRSGEGGARLELRWPKAAPEQ